MRWQPGMILAICWASSKMSHTDSGGAGTRTAPLPSMLGLPGASWAGAAPSAGGLSDSWTQANTLAGAKGNCTSSKPRASATALAMQTGVVY